MNQEFKELFINEYKPTYPQSADPAVIEKYRGILPDNLIGIWELNGWSGYFDGLFWCVNPDDYQGIMDDWLSNTELHNTGEYYVIAKGAFGDLLIFEKGSGHFFRVNSVFGFISLNKKSISKTLSQQDLELAVLTKFVMLKSNSFDLTKDGKGPGIFKDVLKKCGHLKPNEIYGFEPLLSLGGEINVNNISKVNDIVYLSIIREFSEPVVRYF